MTQTFFKERKKKQEQNCVLNWIPHICYSAFLLTGHNITPHILCNYTFFTADTQKEKIGLPYHL